MNSFRTLRNRNPWAPWYLLIVLIGTGYPFRFQVPAYLVERVARPPSWDQERGLIFAGAGMASLAGKAPHLARGMIDAQAYWIALDATPAREAAGLQTLVSYGGWLNEQCVLIGQVDRDVVVQFIVHGNRVPPSPGYQFRVPDVFHAGQAVHVAVSVTGPHVQIFRNGLRVHEADLDAYPVDPWCERCYLSLGNDVSGQTPWMGALRRVAFGMGPLPQAGEAALDSPVLLVDADAGVLPEALRLHVSNVWLRETDAPWRLQPFAEYKFERHPWIDWVINILLLLPIGYAVRRTGFGWGRTLAGVFLLSLAIETLQIFLPARQTDMTDLLLNTVGGVLGAILAVLSPHMVEER